MSRRVYLLGVALTLVALGLAVTDWALSLQPGVTERNVRRIRPGMTLEEVEAVLGGAWRISAYTIFEETGEVERRDRCWGEEDAPMQAVVVFDGRDLVVRAKLEPNDLAPAAKPSSLARLRAWLGW